MSAAPDPSDADPGVLDPERFGELWDDFGADEIPPLLQRFLDDARHDLDAVRAHALEGEAEEMTFHAHRVKGGCLVVGAARLNDAAAAIERRGRAGEAGDDVAGEVRELDEAYAATARALEPYAA